MHKNQISARIFKTAWFAKAAKKAHIQDAALCTAIFQAMQGQCDDLGGGVFKKRLNDNRHRAIMVAKRERWWVYVYLFAKQDRKNIDDDELAAFRKLAQAYGRPSDAEIDFEVKQGDLLEICDDH